MFARPPTFLLNKKDNRHWERIRKLIRNVQKNKYICLALLEFMSKFRHHVTNQMTKNNINKFEYFNLSELIDNLVEQINSIRKILNKKNILFFDIIWSQGNVESLTDIYIHILYLIEKYGADTLVYSVNCYLLVYSGLQDIYFLYDKEYYHNTHITSLAFNNNSNSNNNSNTNSNIARTDFPGIQDDDITGLINSEFNQSANNSKSDKKEVNIYETPGFQSNIYKINRIYSDWVIKCHTRKYINTSNILHTDILRKIYHSRDLHTYEYLDLLSNIIQPLQVNAFTISGNTAGDIHDIYSTLTTFQSRGIVKNKSLFSTNNIVAGIYKDLAQRAKPPEPKQCVWASEINNPLIFTTIPNFEKTRDRLMHIFLRIPVGPKFSILFIINGYIYNESILIAHKYNFTQRQIKFITQTIHELDDISIGFRNNLLKLLNITQILTNTANNTQRIIAWCNEKWQLYNLIIKMPILELMNYFLAQSLQKKNEILTVLILNSDHADSAFRAFILWDMIIDENNGQIEKEIFTQLHTTVQSKLRLILDKNYEPNGGNMNGVSNNSESGQLIKPDELSYEKRILMLKTDDSVRAKATEKLREINNKSNDNSSKPQQYLEGLLNIPFGTYAKEWIIQNSEQILDQSRVIIINFICLCYDYRDIYKWSSEALEWFAGVFGLPGIVGFVNGLSSRVGSPASPNNTIIEDETMPQKCVSSTAIENYLHRELGLAKCGIANIRKLSGYLTGITKSRVLVSTSDLDNTIITDAINSLDPTQIQDIRYELANERIDFPSSRPLSGQTIVCNPAAKKVVIDFLVNEGYFCDIGYPSDLVRYITKVNNLIAGHDKHRADKQRFLGNARARLDASIYGQKDAKDQIIRIIAQWVNGNQDGYCLGFEGSPGLGKTSLAKYGISQALEDANGKQRPFGFIALGGSANGSILEGHSYTYVGSTWGRIVDILMQSRCMNPIIFIDELDKISATENGRELIGILTHLTDRTQNNEFMDKYFAGVKLDLSKVLFIFSYNDYSLLDPILADRIHRVQFENYTVDDKVKISRDYLIPRITNEINMSWPISLDNSTIQYIINGYTYEAGVRKLKEKYYDIFRELNVREISGVLATPSNNDLNMTPELVDNILSAHHKIEIDRPLATPRIGVVYGLYATGMGIGGLTIIQVSRKHADHGGILLCTGKQGDVMMESMKVALTLACSLVPESVLREWGLFPGQIAQSSSTNATDNNVPTGMGGLTEPAKPAPAPKWSFHIHVPDGATSKDGPSAGCAITLGLVSLLLGRSVRNDISMTGEVDMLGNVLPIGGLDAKITGSAQAGIREIMVPRRNAKDLLRIQERTPEICAGVVIHLVDTIQEVLDRGLVKDERQT